MTKNAQCRNNRFGKFAIVAQTSEITLSKRRNDCTRLWRAGSAVFPSCIYAYCGHSGIRHIQDQRATTINTTDLLSVFRDALTAHCDDGRCVSHPPGEPLCVGGSSRVRQHARLKDILQDISLSLNRFLDRRSACFRISTGS